MRFAEVARRHAHIATGKLGWSPDLFWRSTPMDFRLALVEPGSQTPMAHADLTALLGTFPD